MSGVSVIHGWIPLGTSGSLAVSQPYYCGFVIHPVLSTPLRNFTTSQGTKVLGDHEIRNVFCCITEDVPERQALQSVVKYTGTQIAPQWMDVEQGNVSGFSHDFVGVIEVKQTSSKRYAVYRQISLLLRIR